MTKSPSRYLPGIPLEKLYEINILYIKIDHIIQKLCPFKIVGFKTSKFNINIQEKYDSVMQYIVKLYFRFIVFFFSPQALQ